MSGKTLIQRPTRIMRVGDAGDVDPKQTTYVTLTMRKWPKKEKWAAARKSENFWADVIALDSGDLATWLAAAPSVLAWFRRKSGLQPDGVVDVEGFLESWQQGKKFSLKTEILPLDRQESVNDIQSWVLGSPSSMVLRGDSIEEVAAFVCAAIAQLDDEGRHRAMLNEVSQQKKAIAYCWRRQSGR